MSRDKEKQQKNKRESYLRNKSKVKARQDARRKQNREYVLEINWNKRLMDT